MFVFYVGRKSDLESKHLLLFPVLIIARLFKPCRVSLILFIYSIKLLETLIPWLTSLTCGDWGFPSCKICFHCMKINILAHAELLQEVLR